MPIAATSLVTLEEAKAFLAGTVNENQVHVLELVIDSMSEFFAQRTERTLAKTTWTDLYLDGNGQHEIWLPNWPVSVLTSLYEDDVLLTKDTDFYLDATTGRLTKDSGHWTHHRRGLKTTYTAGWVVQGATVGAGETATPARVKMAVLELIEMSWRKLQTHSFGVVSRSLAQQSMTVSEKEIPDFVQDVLRQESRYGL